MQRHIKFTTGKQSRVFLWNLHSHTTDTTLGSIYIATIGDLLH